MGPQVVEQTCVFTRVCAPPQLPDHVDQVLHEPHVAGTAKEITKPSRIWKSGKRILEIRTNRNSVSTGYRGEGGKKVKRWKDGKQYKGKKENESKQSRII